MKQNIFPLKSLAALFGVLVSTAVCAQSQTLTPSSIIGYPDKKQYLPYGSTVPAMVVKLADGTTYDNRTDRKRVAHFWKTYTHRYVPLQARIETLYRPTTGNIASNWTGNLANCDPGRISDGIQEATIRQLNWVRSMAGLMPVTSGTAADKIDAQLAALINRANPLSGLTHNPVVGSTCYSPAAAAAAGSSSLGYFESDFQHGPQNIGLYMDDAGANNAGVGHRLGNLSSISLSKTYGEVAAPLSAAMPFAAVGSLKFGTATRPYVPANEPDILWPTPGFFPVQSYPVVSKRWSFYCDLCDFTGASVTMLRNGIATPVVLEPLVRYSNGAYLLLVWRATEVEYKPYLPQYSGSAVVSLPKDDVFDVTITYKYNGVAKTKSYQTTVFDPEADADLPPSFDVTDMWWNPSESGWGLKVIQGVDGSVFTAIYYYDDAGNPKWVTMQGGWTAPGVFSGKFYATRGPVFNAAPFDPKAVTLQEVGQGTLTFSAETQALKFDFTIGSQTGSKQLVRFANIPETYRDSSNYRGMWWNAKESGWGLTIQHYFSNLFVAWFTYGTDGSPLWVTMQGAWTGASTYEGKLYQTKQAPWNPAVFNAAATVVREVGVAKLTFSEFNRATFEYTLNGVIGSKVIERFEF